jgi:transcriptional regulator
MEMHLVYFQQPREEHAMHVPPGFHEDRLEVIHDIIQQHSFGTLVSSGPNGLEATHLPFLLDRTRGEKGMLLAHMADFNAHWRHLEAASEVLVIFSGPHTYISPTWYTSRRNVPTWNYVAVHAYGRVKLVEEKNLIDQWSRMASKYEQQRPQGWSLQELPEKQLRSFLDVCVGFEIEVTRLLCQRKLSQNRSSEDRRGVIQGLKADGAPDGLAVAELMERDRR